MQKKTSAGRLVILFVLMAVYFFWSQPINAQSGDPAGEISATASPRSFNAAIGASNQDLDGVCLYEVVGGQKRKTYFTRQDIECGTPFVSQGYVTGIMLFSQNPGMAARLGDQRLTRQAEGARFAGDRAEQWMDMEGDRVAGRHHYTFFPRILGDAVHPDDQFCVSVHDGQDWKDLTIHQNGYQPLICAGQPAFEADRANRFRYLGADLNLFLAKVDDLAERLEAVAAGIAQVENAFGVKLVDFVNLLPFKGPDNALTLYGQPQLWFYTDTFRSQSVNELNSMAQHETLHILVDRLGYARVSALKELFADLLGYGPFSVERFSLVTTGALPRAAVGTQPKETPLFMAFINEKNFVRGLSGGHSADSLDEFATSFLHSLLHIDLLEENFRQAELIMADNSRQLLTAEDRRSIQNKYTRTLASFKEVTARQHGEAFAAAQVFFEGCTVSAARVQLECLDAALVLRSSSR